MAAEQPIPIYKNLTDLYSSLGSSLDHAERWNNLAEEFFKRYGRKPAYIARAPGRVNLIGEHVDYALFGVFPAAVERDILIACGPRDGKDSDTVSAPGHVVAQNLHHAYAPQHFTPAPKVRAAIPDDGAVHAEEWHLDIDTKQLRWESYVKAGYFGVLNQYFTPDSSADAGAASHPVPVDLLVTGSVPAGSGLSSSAAMVVASTLAFLAVNGKLDDVNDGSTPNLTKGELVQMAVANEKRVGVNSGGMDQAASVISLPGSALYITFYPKLSAHPTPLPTGAVFVCANSLVVSDKVVTARTRYNLRVVETLVAARVLAKELGIPLDANGEREKITMREVVGRLAKEEMGDGEGGGMDSAQLKQLLEKMIAEVELLKPKRQGSLGLTMEEMITASGLDATEFHEVYLSWVDVEATHFHLYKRAKHVFTEALRVLKFRDVCLAAQDGTTTNSDALATLGELMNESQLSCAKDFECSCPELDELTLLAREAGAIGSRLTGAGWGGCAVFLVTEDKVETFISKMQEGYAPYKNLSGSALHDVLFATKPSTGACVYKFE